MTVFQKIIVSLAILFIPELLVLESKFWGYSIIEPFFGLLRTISLVGVIAVIGYKEY